MHQQDMKRFLYRVHLYEPIHRIWVKRPDVHLALYNLGYMLAGSEDHLPLPPTRLIQSVIIDGEIAVYLRSGSLGKDSIRNVLLRNGYHIEDFNNVLDFGCGCGRIIRQWNEVSGPHFFGTDLNPALIRWCQVKLGKLAEFKTNQLIPPLDYSDETFDLIYLISVFTHLSESVQQEWMRELSRILKRYGLLLITVHGEWRINDLSPEEKMRFRSGELVVRREQYQGSNQCGAYHPEAYVRNTLAKGFEVVDFLPTGAIDVGQDIYLLKKTA